MPGIEAVKEKVAKFVAEEFRQKPDQFRFLTVAKRDDGWTSTVEMTEENQHLKKMGYPTILDRNVYNIQLDGELNIIAFCREGHGAKEEEL